MPECSLYGVIRITDGQNVSAVLKMALLNKFGNVDDEANPLFVSYQFFPVTRVNIITQRFVISVPLRYGSEPHRTAFRHFRTR